MCVSVDDAGHHRPAVYIDYVGFRTRHAQDSIIASDRLNLAVPDRHRLRHRSRRGIQAEGGVVHRRNLAVVDDPVRVDYDLLRDGNHTLGACHPAEQQQAESQQHSLYFAHLESASSIFMKSLLWSW